MTDGTSAAAGAQSEKKWDKLLQKMKTRVLSAVVLAAGLSLVVYGGHVCLWAMLVAFQVVIAKELFAIQQKTLAAGDKIDSKEATDGDGSGATPSFWWHQWWFFWTAAFWLYGRYIRRNLMQEVVTLQADWLLAKGIKFLLKYHALASLSAYIAGFVSFVLSLERGKYMRQFQSFAWAHMVLLCTFIPSSLIVSSLFEGGIIWFLLPHVLIMINDTFAYFFGLAFGRTRLIQLSPSKTWEGFIGGAFSTVVVSWHLAKVMAGSEWLTCPREDLTVFGALVCDKAYAFTPLTITAQDALAYVPVTRDLGQLFGRLVPGWLGERVAGWSVEILPVQIHAVAVSLFASLIAPFGGFFASGFKRAFQIKDFGDSIPGHGGMTDRMDCQIVMGVFVYVYLHSFVLVPDGRELVDSLAFMEPGAKVSLLKQVAAQVAADGLLSPSLLSSIQAVSE